MSSKWIVVIALIFIIEFKFGYSSLIGGNCDGDYNCNVTYSFCLNNKCACSTSQIVDKNGTKCTVPPNLKCKSNGLKCVDRASCKNDICKCDEKYSADDMMPGSYSISPNVCSEDGKSATFNTSCEGTKQCERGDENALCKDGICKCISPGAPKEVSGKTICISLVEIGGKCDRYKVCYPKHSSCKQGICMCNKGYQQWGLWGCNKNTGPVDPVVNNGTNIPAIIGFSVLVVAIIAGISVGVFFYLKRRRNFQRI